MRENRQRDQATDRQSLITLHDVDQDVEKAIIESKKYRGKERKGEKKRD